MLLNLLSWCLAFCLAVGFLAFVFDHAAYWLLDDFTIQLLQQKGFLK